MDKFLKSCSLCPRDCKVNRSNGEKGFCNAGVTVKASRAALHFWEEPCISGERGSGTVFFSYCGLKCVYCQNFKISRGDFGKEITIERLAEIFLELQQKGAHNINLVSPTHYVLQIIRAIEIAKKNGLYIPVVYNTSGYEKKDIIKMLSEYVDIYLTDFKYLSPELSKKYSVAEDYPIYAKEALEEMVSQVKQASFDEDGMMKKGVIVRHLMLPGNFEDSKNIIKYLYENYQNRIFYSLMNQYTPLVGDKYPELNRKITSDEYNKLIDYAIDLGIENGFIQEEGTAKESFIPSFDNEGI